MGDLGCAMTFLGEEEEIMLDWGRRSICWESEEAVKKKNEYIIKLDWGRGTNR